MSKSSRNNQVTHEEITMANVARLFLACALLTPLATAQEIGLETLDGAQEIQPKFVLSGHKDIVYYVAFSPDGKTLLTTGEHDLTMRLWDTRTGSVVRGFTKESKLAVPAFTPNGKTLATSSSYPARVIKTRKYSRGRRYYPDSTIELWDMSTGTSKEIFKSQEIPCCLRLSPNGSLLALSTASMVGKIYLWDMNAEQMSCLAGELPLFVYDLQFSPNGSTFAATVGGDISLWDTATWQVRATLKSPRDGHHGPSELSFSPDGLWLASAGMDNHVRIWYLSNNTLWATLKGFHGAGHLAYSPDGALLAVGNSNGSLDVLDTNTYERRVGTKAHDSFVTSVAFSPDGKLIATGSADRKAKLWETAAFVRQLKAQKSGGEVRRGNSSARRHSTQERPAP
jgi:WD40 repeat protein